MKPGESTTFDYLILYLMPERLIQTNEILRLQWENIKTLIPCFLKSLYTGSIEIKLHELDKIFTGVTKLETCPKGNVLGKVASLWYYLTRIFHQSIGPRVGNFAEELITYWIRSGGLYEIIGRNISLKDALTKLVGINVEKKSKVDFFLKSKKGDRIALIEVRMSEHTGGRTAQQSLLDKIDSFLRLLEDQKVGLRAKLSNRGVREVDLSIAILFSEESHELLTIENYNKGRLKSLVEYIMDDRHVWGAFQKLLNEHRYTFCDSSPLTTSAVIKNEIMERLLDPSCRNVCIQDSGSNIRIWLKILFGDEFFKEYAGSSLNDLLRKHGNIIADDIWLFYAVTINELKIATQLGKTFVRKIYEDLSNSNVFKQFVTEVYDNIKLSINEYVQHLNQWIESCANIVIRSYKEKGEELRLLETNDLVANFEYLKQLCICALAEHLTITRKDGRGFEGCSWE
jgi:hypothetical protein